MDSEKIVAWPRLWPPSGGRPLGEAGATAVEYAIIAAAIAAVVVAIVFVLGGQTLLMFDSAVEAWS